MNFVISFGLIFLINLNSLIFAEQLFHREGRFVDLTLNKYKTQLPSIHDIANSFIHYRMPIAIFIPTVRFNIRAKQRRPIYAHFPTPKKPSTNQVSETQNKLPSLANEQENQLSKSNNKQELVSPTLISREGWKLGSRLSNRSRSFNPFLLSNYKLRSLNTEQTNRKNLNYASVPLSESNVDLIPFLYKDNLPTTSASNLFNSQYQLTNSNPSNLFSQNIAYVQPNSLAPFQPNILFLNSARQPDQQQLVSNQMKNDNQSVLIINQKNNSLPLISMNSTVQSITSLPQETERPINKDQSNSSIIRQPEISNNTSFDVNQVNDNPDEIVQENEPINPSIEETNNLNNDSLIVAANSSINNLINNATNSITNLELNYNRQTDVQPIVETLVQPVEFKNQNFVNELALIDPYRTNLVKRLYTYPSTLSINQVKPKILNSNRAHRSLSIDMPSYVSFITAAVAQSGHSSENRKNLFNRFLDENTN